MQGIRGWGGRIRTSGWRNQNPLPYHLATPQRAARLGGPGGKRADNSSGCPAPQWAGPDEICSRRRGARTRLTRSTRNHRFGCVTQQSVLKGPDFVSTGRPGAVIRNRHSCLVDASSAPAPAQIASAWTLLEDDSNVPDWPRRSARTQCKSPISSCQCSR